PSCPLHTLYPSYAYSSDDPRGRHALATSSHPLYTSCTPPARIVVTTLAVVMPQARSPCLKNHPHPPGYFSHISLCSHGACPSSNDQVRCIPSLSHLERKPGEHL